MLNRHRHNLIAAIFAAAAAVFALPVSAHHGWGGYLDQTSDITGTVEQGVSLAGPHATMKIKADGQMWDVVLAPPARTEAAGLKENTIPVGATVTVHGNRSSNPKKLEIKTTRVTWDKKVFNVYPDRA
jgi:Family of unknown function (DUF6152)